MTIKISKNGTEVSNAIRFVAMSPWSSSVKITEHQIDGADHDVLLHRGRNSPLATITGYCQRTPDNLLILNGLPDEALLTVEHSLEGTRTGMCTALSMSASGTYVNFSMTVKEQDET